MSNKSNNVISVTSTRLASQQVCLFSTTRLARQEASIDPKIEKIVDDIAKLNLLEASSLVSALKVRLSLLHTKSIAFANWRRFAFFRLN